jgi:hypothetical protein
MLQFDILPASLSSLLLTFRCCFSAPTFQTFAALVSGLVASPGRRTVTGMLIGAGMSRVWHHSRAHRFFGVARWNVDQVGLVLLRLIVNRLLSEDAEISIGIDDTLFRRSGRRVHGAGWHHDGSAQGPSKNRVSWGNCWIIAGVIVDLPFLNRPVCLPVAFALWRAAAVGKRRKASTTGRGAKTTGHKRDSGPMSGDPEGSKQAVASRLITMIAAACPGRQIHVVADAWYAGMDGAPGAGQGACRHRGLPAGVTLTSRLRVNAGLTAIAPLTPGRAGRPKRKGDKIGTPKDLANRADTIWTAAQTRRYGSTTTVTIAETLCLWYGVYRSRTVRVILLRNADTTTGYNLALITTDLTTPATKIIERYASRWSIEVAIENAKQHTGVGEARNRTTTAVHRTVPFGLITQSLVYLWYAEHGHDPNTITQRRHQAPWYRTKTHPSYQDMITKLRRTLIVAKFRAGNPDQATPTQILDITQAWEAAAA